MISLFLVEDELISRQGIEKNVPWAENGINFLGSASDGELALPQILEKKPDIVLTDIRMPFMDGLQLSRIIREKLPETKIIILSGYNEFDYARQAITLGISEYLLKPVSAADILGAVDHVRGAIDSARQGQARQREQQQLRQEMFFSSLYSGFLSDPVEILHRAETLGLSIAAAAYRVVIAEFTPPFAEQLEQWKDRLYRADNALASGFNGRQAVYLLYAENEQALDGHQAALADMLDACLAGQEQQPVLQSGETVRRLGDLDQAYQTARQRRNRTRKTISSGTLLGAKPFATQELLEFLRTGRDTAAQPFWEHYRPALETAVHSYIYRCYLLTELFFAIRHFVDEIGAPAPAVLTNSELSDQWISSCGSADEMIAQFGDLCAQVMQERDRRCSGRYVSAAEAARQYVDQHYAESELSLSLVATAVNVSPNHLSTVFKEKNGIGFSDYVTEVRIRQSKRLLITTDLRASEIGERVGYQNMNYFSMLFKKMTGVSPSQYRREHKL